MAWGRCHGLKSSQHLAGECFELLPAQRDVALRAADGAVRGAQVEHRLTGVVGQRHQTAVVAHRRDLVLLAGGVRVAQHAFGVDVRQPAKPPGVRRDRTVQAHARLHDDVPQRLHSPLWSGDPRWHARQDGVNPGLPPLRQDRPEGAQPLQAEKVCTERDDDGVGDEQGGAVQRPQVRADVDDGDVRADGSRRTVDDAGKGRRRAHDRWIRPGEAAGPGCGELLLEAAERQVAGQQPEPVVDLASRHGRDVADTVEDGLYGSGDARAGAGAPQRLELLLPQEAAGEVRLRVQIDDQDPSSEPAHLTERW